jgi:hypothetical protein
MTAMLFYILQERKSSIQVSYFQKSVSFQDPTLSGTNRQPIIQIREAAILLLVIAGN